MGQVVTFYSYKGGVGRTMALANVATLLARWGYKTLLVDWDLEAPGLEFYFQDFVDIQQVVQQEGLVDLLERAEGTIGESLAEGVDWENAVIEIEVSEAKESIHLITAGQRDEIGRYFDKVTRLDWAAFYQHKGGFLIESLRSEWKKKYDYVLIDSRTGITDIGGICTIQLPDVLVLLFTATDQSLNGVVEVAAKAQAAQWDLPFDRTSLTCLPIPSRFDSNEEFTISRRWLNRFVEVLKDIYDDWLPLSVDRRRFLEVTKIPYSSYFSFGEKLPVIEQGTTDPAGLGYAYENLAAIVSNDFESVEELLIERDHLVAKQSSRKSEVKIFISYAKEDYSLAFDLYTRLRESGYSPWLDRENLLPGQNWRIEIHEAIKNSDIFLACLSNRSIDKQGYVQQEFKFALNYATRAQANTYVIPLRFDDAPIPDLSQEDYGINLKDIQWLDYWREGGFEMLIKSIEHSRLDQRLHAS